MRLQGATLNSGVLMNDKPRHGYVYEAMRRSRSQFKYALRQCKRSEGTIKADRLAGDLHNVVDFCKNVRNLTSNKASNSTCIDAVVGEQNIADYWRSHYEGIFNSVQNTTHQNEILKLNFCQYPSIHTNYIISHCTTL